MFETLSSSLGDLRTNLKLRRLSSLRHVSAVLSEWSQTCLRLAKGRQSTPRDPRGGIKTKTAWTAMLTQFGRPEVIASLINTGVIGDDLPRIPGPPSGERLLVLAAHQDDETIGAGGTFVLCARRRCAFEVVYYTDGATSVANLAPDAVVRLRQTEARAVWRRVAGIEPLFWGYRNRDREMAPDAGARLAAAIDAFKPDTIFLPSFLEQPFEHRRLNDVLLAAHALRPLDPSLEVWGYQITSRFGGNRVVDITSVWKQKYAVNQLWRSQNAYLDYAHLAMGRDIAGAYYLKGATRRPASHAELFLAFDVNTYLKLAAIFSRTETMEAGAPQ